MKIAVLSDIHANYVALLTVAENIEAWQPDAVIMAGDLVNRGPRPAECLRFVQEKQKTCGWQVIRGNHEDYVISQAKPDAPRSGPAFEVHRASIWTYEQLERDVSALEAMPFQQSLVDPSGGEVRVVHGSMVGNRDGIYPETSDKELGVKIENPVCTPPSPPPVLFCVGHTHRSLIRRLDGTLVVNAGSVGLPFDADTRPAYAQLTWQHNEWRAEIIRLNYDLEQARRDIFESGYHEGGGPLVRIVQIELEQARSLLFNWAIDYQQRALAGDISMQACVDEFLMHYL